MAVLDVDSERSNIPCFIFSSCSGVPSTVLVTPVQALSKSIAVLLTRANAPVATPLAIDAFLPTSVILPPAFSTLLPKSDIFSDM